jgi:hypothetical protein
LSVEVTHSQKESQPEVVERREIVEAVIRVCKEARGRDRRFTMLRLP